MDNNGNTRVVPDIKKRMRKCIVCGLPRFDADFTSDQVRCDVCVFRARDKELTEKVDSALQNTVLSILQRTQTGESATEFAPVVDGLFARFGGVDGFCDDWYSQIAIAMRDRPGTMGILNHFKAIAELVKKAKPDSPLGDLSKKTDAELISAVRSFLVTEQTPRIEGPFSVAPLP